KTITGNVFFTDNSQDPQFLWCQQTGATPAPNPSDSQFMFTCFAAPPCAQARCSSTAFVQIAQVPLPGSFLYPPGTSSTFGGNIQPIFDASCATNIACHVAGGAGPVNLSSGAAYGDIFQVLSTEAPSLFYVAPFNSDSSYLFQKISGVAQPQM